LLLPATGADWPESQRRDALLHELAHIRRFDYLGTRLSRLACAIHWYNPLVWFAAAQARKLQEQACDDAVLRGGGTPSDYAQFLLSIAVTVDKVPGDFRIAIGMTRHSHLYGRVIAILEPHRARMQPSVFASLVALLPMSCLMLVLAATTTVTAQDAEPVARVIEVQTSQAEQKARAAEDAQRAEEAIVAVPAVKPLPPKPPVVPPVPPSPAVPPPPPAVEPVPPVPPPG